MNDTTALRLRTGEPKGMIMSYAETHPMTVRTTLSFTDRHHSFLVRKVQEGVFASTSAAVGSAVEAMIEDEVARETALEAMAAEIRARMATQAGAYRGMEEVFADVRAGLAERSADEG